MLNVCAVSKPMYMKKVLCLILFVTITSCANYVVDSAFKQMGIYEDYAKVDKLVNDKKEVVFIPMHHFGTKSFYNDVNKKVDSLENLGFQFYTEGTNTYMNDTITLLKLRKLTEVPFSKNQINHLEAFNVYYNGKIKYKKELVVQPSYKILGIDSLKGRNVDVTSKDMIHYYESKYGELILEDCDYKTPLNEKPTCKSAVSKKQVDDAILHFRNAYVIEEVQKDTHQKIAIIYGAKHFIGIREELLKLGYK